VGQFDRKPEQLQGPLRFSQSGIFSRLPGNQWLGEDWYYFDYGKTRFIAHPEPYSGAWADWNTKAKVLMDATGSDPTATGYMANDFVGIEGLKKSDFSQIVSTVPAITTLILSADGRKLQDIRK
jgi:hypothetical protein